MFKKITGKIKSSFSFQKNKTLLKNLDSTEIELIKRIKNKNLTYLSDVKMANIVYSVNGIKDSKLDGIFIEAGCALGGSTILISKLKNTSTTFKVYDVFGMIPPPTQEDTHDVHNRYRIITEGKSPGIGNNLYYGYEENLYEKVLSNLNSFNVFPEKENINIIKGLVQETMDINEPVVFAHIDVDWYEPVKTCLQQIWANLSVGGILILDDYHDWGGCRKATDEYFRKYAGRFSMDDRFGSMKITKIN